MSYDAPWAEGIIHDPDDAWQYAPISEVPVSRWVFGGAAGIPTPHIWNGAAWVRWYGPGPSEYRFLESRLDYFVKLIEGE